MRGRLEIETIAVIGAGTAGRSIACVALGAGYRVILEDVLPERLAAALSEIREALQEAAARGSVSTEPDGRRPSRLSTAASVDAACREADLVIETLPDDVEMKIDVFCILERFARPGAILAASAASVGISEIAAVTTRAERCVGLNFSNGAAERHLLKIVRGRETSDETVEACRELGRRLGREVVVEHESPVGTQ